MIQPGNTGEAASDFINIPIKGESNNIFASFIALHFTTIFYVVFFILGVTH
jgi:hypothetical protein